MPRMAEVPGGGTVLSIYDENFTVSAGGLAINDLVTLPNSGSYTDKDLEVYFNGQLLEDGIDFDYVGSDPRTQIKVLRTFEENEEIRFRNEFEAVDVYDETIVVGAGGLSAGSTVTLPATETYTDIDLTVYLDGQLLEAGQDYNYVGVAPRTQIQLVIDLLETERLRFRKGS